MKVESKGELWGAKGKSARFMRKLMPLLAKAAEADRKLLLHLAQKLSGRNSHA
jgi:hypothetical protein